MTTRRKSFTRDPQRASMSRARREAYWHDRLNDSSRVLWTNTDKVTVTNTTTKTSLLDSGGVGTLVVAAHDVTVGSMVDMQLYGTLSTGSPASQVDIETVLNAIGRLAVVQFTPPNGLSVSPLMIHGRFSIGSDQITTQTIIQYADTTDAAYLKHNTRQDTGAGIGDSDMTAGVNVTFAATTESIEIYTAVIRLFNGE